MRGRDTRPASGAFPVEEEDCLVHVAVRGQWLGGFAWGVLHVCRRECDKHCSRGLIADCSQGWSPAQIQPVPACVAGTAVITSPRFSFSSPATAGGRGGVDAGPALGAVVAVKRAETDESPGSVGSVCSVLFKELLLEPPGRWASVCGWRRKRYT